MSHTLEFGTTVFNFNSDMSGDVLIQVGDRQTCAVPGGHLLLFMAEIIRRRRIEALEDADSDELLS